VKLLCHINDDEDLLQAWLDYYTSLGVSSFHFIVHGAASENVKLFQLAKLYPILVEDAYDGPFSGIEKRKRIEPVLANWRGQWVLWVDSDEFVEFPYRRLTTTIRVLEFFKANALSASMVQRLTEDGGLKTPGTIPHPFRHFPLCSVDLYRRMGVEEAATSKYPLFYCQDSTKIIDGGNHNPPNGLSTVLSPLQGVTHHFKWRGPALRKIASRAQSPVSWRHESASYLAYLESHDFKVPTEDSFSYSRAELFRRGLLKKATPWNVSAYVLGRVFACLPGPFQTSAASCYRALRRALPRPE